MTDKALGTSWIPGRRDMIGYDRGIAAEIASCAGNRAPGTTRIGMARGTGSHICSVPVECFKAMTVERRARSRGIIDPGPRGVRDGIEINENNSGVRRVQRSVRMGDEVRIVEMARFTR